MTILLFYILFLDRIFIKMSFEKDYITFYIEHEEHLVPSHLFPDKIDTSHDHSVKVTGIASEVFEKLVQTLQNEQQASIESLPFLIEAAQRLNLPKTARRMSQLFQKMGSQQERPQNG